MQKIISVKKAFFIFITIAMLLPGVAISAEITINYITFLNKRHHWVKTYKDIFKEIEKRSNHQLVFRYRGGPESIKIFEQAMAVKKGATDMVLTSPSFTGRIVKGPVMMTLSKVPVSQHLEKGIYDFMNTLYNPTGLQFLQIAPEPTGVVFRIMSKEKITSTDQFRGKTLRGGDWMDAVAPKLGMQTIAMRFSEDYTAMERGLIDISRMTTGSLVQFRIYDVSKFLIKTGWGSAPASWIMNLKKWESIPGELQDLIIDTLYEKAEATQKHFQAEIKKAEKILVSKGVEIVELEDEERFLQITEKAMYDYFLKEDPVVAKKVFDISQ